MANLWYPGTGGGGSGGTATAVNFPSAPGDLQINGTSVERYYADRRIALVTITSTANYGQANHGTGAFDGSSAGHFVGSSSGTVIAANAASGFAGNLLDVQVAGSSKLSISSGGNVVAAGSLSAGAITTSSVVNAQTLPPSTANNGLLNLGSGGFAGGGTNFIGSASGTHIALNAPAAYAGNLVDLQVAGVSKFKVDGSGTLTVAGFSVATLATNNINFNASPANLQISGTTVATLYTDRTVFPHTVTATANYGLLSLGGGPFDGTSAGHYVGSANGSLLAGNAVSAFSGDLINIQINGTSKFKVDSGGNIVGNSLAVNSFSLSNINLSTNPSTIQVTGTTLLTLYTDRIIQGTAVTATANYGTVNTGSAPFDGTTTGHFAGSANGTLQALNAPTGFTGNLLDAQVNGVSKASLDASGNLIVAGTITGTFSQAGVNLTSNPGNLQVTGTTVQTLYTDRTIHPAVITASANYGQLNLGNGTFDGVTAGHFVGNAQGTALAINPATGYTGDLLNAEVAGVSKFKVDASGNLTVAGTITGSFSVTGVNFSASPGNLQVTGTTVQTLYTDRTIFGTAVAASANYGTVSVGSGAWDGAAAGHFVGSSSGTLVGFNAPSGFGGNLADAQVAGVSKFKVDASGNVTAAGTITGTFSFTGINFSSNPGNLQVTGTTVMTLYTDRVLHPTAPTASANYGRLSLGNGAFDGTTTGFFVGSASGTYLAINTATGYVGNLVDLQVQGVSKFKVSATGGVTVPTLLGTSIVNAANNGPLLDVSGTTTTLSQRNNVASPLFVVKGMASQTADLQQWQDSTSAIWARISSTVYGTTIGLLSLGNAPYDGSSAGHFVGSANGTVLAINTASGYTGNLIDAQLAGSSKFKVDASGNLTVAGTISGTLSLSSINLSTSPGNIQVTGTTLQTLYTDRIIFPTAVTATANYGLLNLGSGAFDGSTGGHFVGSSSGTVLAINAPTAFAGNLLDLQVLGVGKAKVTAAGEFAGAGIAVSLASKTSSYTVTTGDAILLGDATSGSVTFTLPAASAVVKGRVYEFKRIDTASGNSVVVAAAGSDTIDGLATLVLASQYQAVAIYSDGTSKWYIRASYA